MKTVSEKVWLAAVGLIVLYSVYPTGVHIAEPVTVDGVDPLSPVSRDGVIPAVSGKRLEVALPGRTELGINGWPTFLPQEFSPQKINASRLLRAQDPVDRIAFTRMTEQRPWLLVGTGANPSDELFDGWHLQFNGKDWSLSNSKEEKHLRTNNKPARPTIVAHGKERWCVYLLCAESPDIQRGLAAGNKIRAAWAAIRLSSGQRHLED